MRNFTLTRIAGFCWQLGMGSRGVENALHSINSACCSPPVPEAEVKSIAKSISRYERGVTALDSKPQPFPVDVFPPKLAEYVESICEAMGCDAAMFAPHVLAVASAAIGNARRIKIKESWREPAVVWIAVVAESGTLKSPALDHAMAPIHEMQRCARSQYEAECKQYELSADDPDRGAPPVLERYLTGDTTVEALVTVLDGNPRGVLLSRDELSGWLTGFDAYRPNRGKDASSWLEIHGARQITVDRKSTDKRVICVDRAFVSVCGGIQPGILRRVLLREHRESGFAARLLLVMPPRKHKRWTESDVSVREQERYSACIQRLYDLKPGSPTESDKCPPIELTMSPQARELWAEFYDEHNQEALSLHGDLAASWSKLEGYTSRFALILEHLHWSFAQRAKKRTQPTEISEKSMRDAIRLTQWFCGETKRIYAMMDQDQEADDTRGLAEVVRKHGGSITARDLARYNKKYSPSEAAKGKLDQLVARGLGRWEEAKPGKRGGRPTKKFILSD